MKKILLVEDEAHVASFIKKGLTEEGYDVSVAFDGNIGWDMFQQSRFDLVILDIMLPGKNGIEVCALIRQVNTSVPVLFLTALGTSENIVLGLNTGADDYMVKPFKFIEFLARIKTLLRRTEGLVNELPIQNANTYTFLNLFIDDNAKTVFRDEVEINLTSTEYRLLIYFLQNKNIVLSRMDILENVWGLNFNLGTNVVDVYVNYLRKKIDQNFEPKLIHTVIGMGYIMKEK
jgi:two-component system copper resistance phosphate regulon response regulator CusR